MSEGRFTLVGNDSNHVVSFTEIETGSGNVGVSGLKGGVYLLDFFIKTLKGDRSQDFLKLGLGIREPNSAIELFTADNENSFRVRRQLHVPQKPPKRMQIENQPYNRGMNATVVALEHPAAEDVDSMGKLYDYVSTSKDILICKIAHNLSKENSGEASSDKSLLRALVARKDQAPRPTAPIIIIDAKDLRNLGAEISEHLSWSKTAEGFARFLSSENTFINDLNSLGQPSHLIVRFDCDGTIHYLHNADEEPSFDLYYVNPKFAEGDYIQHLSGAMTGLDIAFMAGFAFELARETPEHNRNFRRALECGMEKACRLASAGFKKSGNGLGSLEFEYPDISATGALANFGPKNFVHIEKLSDVKAGGWSILNSIYSEETARLDLAMKIVREGPEIALANVPTAQFNRLITVDREEKERFRAIANLVQDYMRSSQKKPLSIGVFGHPGSGKSFGVGEVIDAVAKHLGKEAEKLTFNLSQFLEYSDLLAAFQNIRDQTFSNKIPVVMFDEFDCSFGGKPLGWLQYFLAPMQDGQFLERGHLRPLGSAIFIFVGGTSSTFEAFCATLNDREAVAAKKPDFASRLRGSVDIWGPNKLTSRDDGDKTYSIRRAIVLRSLLEKNKLLKKKAGSQKKNDYEEFKVTDSVLNALLCVSAFRHGTRSLEGIIQASQVTPGQEFAAAGLPSDDRLGLQLDPVEFGEWLNGWTESNEKIRTDIAEMVLAKIQEPSMRWVEDAQNPLDLEEKDVKRLSLTRVEEIELSKAVAKDFSLFLGAGKALDLKRDGLGFTDKERAALARGIYDRVAKIRSEHGSPVELPWWFIDQVSEPERESWYHQVAMKVSEELPRAATAERDRVAAEAAAANPA
ncbi:hypothetical protein ASPCADRAFT_130126 [Aspergillus carbonarius ITEM 5010]|uniref:ATPase AAA-type core domain-containing protein n=1 Tax=Aspergillus carbonarius (strain ITEM 5010) TaxID=602072 RepID=A0A1R3RMU6_ASPC5|nr:hypothetical protein ASPCADRAFT_130126 [Aspergillus carbonarius ITEM 5010]